MIQQLILWTLIAVAAGSAFLILIVLWGKAIHDEAPITVPPRTPDTCKPDCSCRGTQEVGPEFWTTVAREYRHAMDEDRAQQITEGVPARLLYRPEGDDQ